MLIIRETSKMTGNPPSQFLPGLGIRTVMAIFRFHASVPRNGMFIFMFFMFFICFFIKLKLQEVIFDMSEIFYELFIIL